MPRDGNGVYSKPAGTTASPNVTIESAKYNAFCDDLVADANAARPITAGGTGATTAAGARDALGLEIGVDIPSNDQLSMVDRRNRIVNGDMAMSQENGTSSGTSTGYYAADQWATYRVTSAGTITSARVASVSPAGSPYRYRVTITTGDASLAAGEYLTITQNLEGSNVADFQYGGSSAKDAVLRFGFKGPAGTYAARVGNSAANRSFVALFTISAGQANTDTVQEVAIPGDTTGTWLTADGVIGMTLEIVLAAGSTYHGVAGWQAGMILGTSGVSNGMASADAVFELFDVGLKLDPDATGVYGAYEVGEVDAVYNPLRYGYRWTATASDIAIGVGTQNNVNGNCVTVFYAPSVLCKESATVTFSTASGFSIRFGNQVITVDSISAVASGKRVFFFAPVIATGGTNAVTGVLFGNSVGATFFINARLS